MTMSLEREEVRRGRRGRASSATANTPPKTWPGVLRGVGGWGVLGVGGCWVVVVVVVVLVVLLRTSKQ